MEKKNQLQSVEKQVVQNMMARVNDFALMESTPLSQQETNYAIGIIMATHKQLLEKGINWNQVNVLNCQFPAQVKRFARLGLSIDENEIFIDIRNNKNSSLKDITIKKQYFGIQKEMMRFCSKEVVRFLDGTIVKGDEFEEETDFETGLTKIVKHKKGTMDRNKLENITGAYAIAYVKENDKLVQYVSIIDRNRIMRAYNASASREKTVWKLDTQRMVIKTAYWTLYNNVMKPYMNIPTDLLNDWKETQDQMDFDNKENNEVFENQTINFDEPKPQEPQREPQEQKEVYDYDVETGEVNLDIDEVN